MHEISLVQNLFQQIRQLAAEHNATKIHSVTMEIGPFCGVVVDSFQFGFDILSADDDLLRGAKLIIETPEVSFTCSGCKHLETVKGEVLDACPECGDTFLLPNGGEDLLLRQVEME